MTRSAGHFEEFKPHSKHKHLILEHYFKAWSHKLGLREGAGREILYVDACAGRGADDVGNDGSPLIAARAAAAAQENVAGRRGESFRIHVMAIEANRNHFAALAETLAPFSPSTQALPGSLDEHLPELERRFAGAPSLYFFDPFGLEPLPASSVRRALQGDRHEALILFADLGALRHFGALAAHETQAERKLRAAERAPWLFTEMEAETLATLEQAAIESREGLEMTREAADRILNSAFGDPDWMVEIASTPKADRRATFLRLYSDRLRTWGATLVLPIPIVDASGSHVYTLVHASKHARAYVAMKDAVTYALKNSPLPTDVVSRMRAMVKSSIDDVEAKVLQQFASKPVRWSTDKDDRLAPNVRDFVLEETGAFPFELDALKDRLSRFKSPGRTIVYSFP